jgi:2-pyrone-4,6-dicarboxylate lactonase
MIERTIPPPRPDPHAPRAFTPPLGAVDAHCHVFGPAARFPFAPDRAYTPPDAGIADFQRLQQHLGLSHAVFVQASCHGTDNSALLDALRRGRGRYSGVAMVDESFGDDQLGELHDAGVRGTRFNFVRHLGGAPEPERFWRVVERVAELGWHLVLHVDATDLVDNAEMLARLPVPYVVDHMGRVPVGGGLDQAPFRALLEMLRDDRCWVKLSGAERLSVGGPPYDDVVPFARALIHAAPERVLWGTDWPHPNVPHMPDDGDLLDLVAAFAPDEASRRQLLVSNPRRLYPLSAPDA